MRKADYVALADTIRMQANEYAASAAALIDPNAKLGQSRTRSEGDSYRLAQVEGKADALERLARALATNLSIDNRAFLLACGYTWEPIPR